MPTQTNEERRSLPLATAGVEIRSAADGEPERFRGYAAVFNTRAAIGNPLSWGFYEEMAQGAFAKTLSESDARMLVDHDTYYVVSRTSAGSLSLSEDAHGLVVDSTMDDELSYVRDLKANLRNGNITGMSFGFQVVKDEWRTEEVEVAGHDQPAEVEVRTIREVRLVEVSAVSFPAYTETEAELRSVASALTARGDRAAIERSAEHRPELSNLLDALPTPVEPGESTRQEPVSRLLRRYAMTHSLPVNR